MPVHFLIQILSPTEKEEANILITFDASNIVSYEKFDLFIKNNKDLFETRKNILFDKFDILMHVTWDDNKTKFKLFRNKYNNLVQRTICRVIKYYREFLPKECLIVEFGSFVKGTERILSDIDLTICYDALKTKDLECAEMIINYTITKILGYSIDHIHGKFQHYPQMHEFDHLTEKDNYYRIIFSDNKVDFKCGPETLQENLMNIKNVRDYKTMLEGYEEKYLLKCNIDCLYSIRVIENSTRYNFIEDLALLEKKYNICSDYVFKLSTSTLSNPFSISNLKKTLKNDGVVELYIFLSKLRKSLQPMADYSMDLDTLQSNRALNSYFGHEYTQRLFDSFLKFVFYWNRVELSLNYRSIALSTRCKIIFTHKEINRILNQDWGETTDIELLIAAKNEMMELIKAGLEKIRD